jgi:3',5'-cyclic AMP phosphodiesterase CpdA
LLSKRGLGWASWQAQRRRRYRPEVLDALLADLHAQAPDQIAITGDLTQVALEEEFREAASWLTRVGPPERVSAIPGNHDATVRVSEARGLGHWSGYLESDVHAERFRSDPGERFPSVRVRDGLALVGVCTARPTGPFSATGRVGAQQLGRLAETLARLGEERLCRIVLIHHPPLAGVTLKRRSLTDASAFGEVLRSHGAELVLHGHLHRTHVAALAGPAGDIPVIGVPSASCVGPSPARRAAYHLFEIDVADAGSVLRRRTRTFDPATRGFVESRHGSV